MTADSLLRQATRFATQKGDTAAYRWRAALDTLGGPVEEADVCGTDLADAALLRAYGVERAGALTRALSTLLGLAGRRWERLHSQQLRYEISPLEVVTSCLGDALARLVCPLAAAADDHRVTESFRPRVVRCLDGFVLVSAPTAEDRQHLATLLGSDTESMEAAVGGWAASLTRAAAVDEAQAWRLPVLAHCSAEEVQSQGAADPYRVREVRHMSVVRPTPGDQPLAGLTIVELGGMWAAPFAGRLLTALGARVIKVEGPHRPDGTRPPAGVACLGAFADLNRGKQSLVVDLATEAGRQQLRSVIAHADGVLENFSPRVLPNLGLSYASLVELQPRLVMVSMPAFDSGGPWAHYTAYGPGLELAGGLAACDAGGVPRVSPIAFLDYLAGLYGAIATVALILARDISGSTAHIEVAQYEVARDMLTRSSPRGITVMNPHPERWVPLAELRASGLLAPVARPAAACGHLLRPPWQCEALAPSDEPAAPAFGAHTREILAATCAI